jgi:hypothetical protein
MTRRTWLRLAVLPVLFVSAVALAAGAKAKRPPRPAKVAEKYLLSVVAIEHADGVTTDAAIDEQARAMLVALLAARADDFVASVDGAPDPKDDAAKYADFLKAHGVRAFDVRIKITKYERTLTPAPDKPSDQVLTVKLSLELLGANVPSGTLAFTGHGSAEVSAEVGKKVPPKMEAGVRDDVFKGALGHALDEAVAQLRAPKKK